jgi:tRNA(Leu) C34 or U34 (ribose-2'-O)-methylase TrmL
MVEINLWDQIKEELHARMKTEAFHNWVAKTELLEQEENRLRVLVPDEATRVWLEREYAPKIQTAIQNLNLPVHEIHYELARNGAPARVPIENNGAEPMFQFPPATTHLNPRLTFDSFVVGTCNQFAHAAAKAVAAGADAVVCCEGTVDLWNPKAVRSSAGAVFHVPIVAAGAATDVLAEIGEWGLKRLGTVSEGGADYAAEDLTSRVAFIFGNEAAGLPVEELRTQLDGLVSIPMARGAESLNVGMAAAIICFEVARQRRHGAPASSGDHVALRLGQGAAE